MHERGAPCHTSGYSRSLLFPRPLFYILTKKSGHSRSLGHGSIVRLDEGCPGGGTPSSRGWRPNPGPISNWGSASSGCVPARHRLNGYLVLKGSIPLRASQLTHIPKLLARKRLGTEWARYPFSRCRPASAAPRRARGRPQTLWAGGLAPTVPLYAAPHLGAHK